MAVDLRGVTAVLLPGTGSDDDFVYRVFAPALHDAGATVVTPAPQPDRLVRGYREALDDAVRLDSTEHAGPVVVGGISLGAAVAAAWALEHPGRALAVLAALPAWTGSPLGAPAAMAARFSAGQLRRDGLVSATAAMRAGSPRWLGDELSRSWAAQWPSLPDALEEAAGFVAPTTAELGSLCVPMGVAAATDDLVHPAEVAFEWVSAAPRAALRTITLEQMASDPAVLGAACVGALSDVQPLPR